MAARVFVVDKAGRRRDALVRSLAASEEAVEVAGADPDPARAEAILEAGDADLVLLACQGSAEATAEVVTRLRTLAATPILVLAERERPEDLVRVLSAGARGVIGRRLPTARLVEAIHAAVSGGVVLDPGRTEGLLRHLRVLPNGDPAAPLTPREAEVLRHLCRGETYEGVAARLGIGHGTVQSHVKSIYRKLSVDSKTAAARVARAQGFGVL